MRPLFTIHAGEYVVGEHIEKAFPSLDIWIPAKDSGIDLLVTGRSRKAPISLQVKLSRDYKPMEAITDFDKGMLAQGWLTIDHAKLANSKADLWVIVLVSHERKQRPLFVLVPPQHLLRKLVIIHGNSNRYQFYPWVTRNGACLDGRGLSAAHKRQLADGAIVLGERDFSSYLGNWRSLELLADKM